jgi:hypothetical protein
VRLRLSLTSTPYQGPRYRPYILYS